MDTLAHRYGWNYSDIYHNMYWEDVWEMFELASNQNCMEKNSDMKFQYMLNAPSKKAMQAWKDEPIPYPDRAWQPKPKRVTMPVAFNRHTNRKTMSPDRKARFDEVLKRTQDKAKEVRELKRKYYGS